MADIANLAANLYDVFNRRDFDAFGEAVAPDGRILLVGSGDTYEGPEGARRYATMWADAFPDGSVTVDRVLPVGDTAVVEFTGRGTHTGDLVSPAGTVPATGRSVTLQFCDILDFRDGKVTSQHTYYDTGALMAQLGLMEQATTAQRTTGE